MSDKILCAVAGLLGLLGLFVASRALDPGISIFGGVLVAFALIYIFHTIRRTVG